ncbi:MAG: FprA family A-type flavoprotein [Oscillospiraceae bacterium]
MKDTNISTSIRYIGVDDKTIDLFEGQYAVPNGISYNSYIIIDDKIAVLDTVDKRETDAWIKNLESALDGREPDFLISLHIEPDHAGNIGYFMERYPEVKLVASAKAVSMLPQFFDFDVEGRTVGVKDRDTLCLGRHTLTFFMAPMIHWPEVMVAYDDVDKVLFSADAFGKFGTLDTDEDWTDEARRYYMNIVGKYGAQVQSLFKKLAGLEIRMICSLHGPILKGNIDYYIGKYRVWSRYEPEDEGVLIAYASMHGNTREAIKKFAEILKTKGAKRVIVTDLARSDIAKAVEDAFRYDKLVVASPTYDGNLFPVMEDFLYHLKIKTYRCRRVGIIENGSWAPASGKLMRAYFESMKNIEITEPMVSIRSVMRAKDIEAMEAMAEEILK